MANSKSGSRSSSNLKQIFFKNAPLGLVLLLATIVVLETGIVIGGYIYYQKLVEYSQATDIPTLKMPKTVTPAPTLPTTIQNSK